MNKLTTGDMIRASSSVVNYDEVFKKLDYYKKNGRPRGETTGWRLFDQYFTFPPEGQLNLVTGTPGSGKSEWLDSLIVQCAAIHGWNVFIYSPENCPAEFHVEKLCSKFLGEPILDNYNGHPMASLENYTEARKFIEKQFVIYDSMLNIASVDGLIKAVKTFVRDYNIRILVIDPWNKVDRKVGNGMDKIDFLGKCLVDLQIEVARAMGVHVFIVAHPTKPRKDKEGNYKKTSLYDVSGGAYFFDMIDNGFICHRSWNDKLNSLEMEVTVSKVKNRFYGKPGEAKFRFQPWCGSYEYVK